MRIYMQANAKINWSLNILALREDGYHELDMLMQSIELSDELTFDNARWLSLNIDGRPLPVGDRNLIIRAAKALNSYMGQRNGARINLTKRIPVRAGLGGGSADCAATLIALNRLWNLRLPMEQLMAIGRTLGADVPFCMQGGLAHVRGVGEIMTPLENAPAIPLAMVTPGRGLSTAAVFKAWDEGNYPISDMNASALADALIRKDLSGADTYAFNALEAPAIKLLPDVAEAIRAFRKLGARLVRMTGSGSTVFAAFETDEEAQSAAAKVPGAVFTRTVGAQ